MTGIYSLLTILFLIVNTTSICGQPTQVGIIDNYGTITNEAVLRRCLPFMENDTLKFLSDSAYPKTKKAIEDCLLSQPGIKQANLSFICCVNNDNKWIVFIGTDTKPKADNQRVKTQDLQLPGQIKSLYDSLMSLLMVAIEKGEATEDDSSGHALMTYLPARQLQQEFVSYANNNLAVLREVLKKSKYIEQREVAATVIAYYIDKTAIVTDLLNAVSDPGENVRNNAVRALGIIANYSNDHPDLKIKIPAGPFIDMMNSITWTDRNKSSFVLLSLTITRNKDLLNQLKEQALKPIVDMAKWKSYGHAMPGYIMLGRIAGWSDNEIMDGANANKAVSIEKMLTTINN